MAAQIDYFIDMLIANWALILTITTGRTRPDFCFRHHIANKL
jgi:hypothetical protein